MGAEGLVAPLHPVLPRARQAALALLRPLHLLGKAATTNILGSVTGGRH